MVNAFDKIYEGNTWGFGSGHGSLVSVTKGYRKFLQEFIRKHDIRSVVDYGCGDWQFSRLIDWSGVDYTGLDVAKKVVEINTERFGKPNIHFRAVEPMTHDLPPADLLVSKDVLQHLTRPDVEDFIKNILPRYKYALITNCATPENILNVDIQRGEFRPLDLRKAPYNVNAEKVFEFETPRKFSWKQFRFFVGSTKFVLLIKN